MIDAMQRQAIDFRNLKTDEHVGDGGLVYCKRCKTPRSFKFDIPSFSGDKIYHVGVLCTCQLKAKNEQRAAEKEQIERENVRELQRAGITDAAYEKHTFDKDDGRNAEISAYAMQYAEKYYSMQEQKAGVIFYGDVGTGKTFFAAAIANFAIKYRIPAIVTSFPRIINELSSGYVDDQREVLKKLMKHDLIVIDDLGVERESPMISQKTYELIDELYKAEKLLIVTTNLSIEDLKNPNTLSLKRVYDRILEMCPLKIKLAGESRRIGMSTEREQKLLYELQRDMK